MPNGDFGENVTSLDYDAATNEFLTGNAAMIYMGSWLLGAINDQAVNQIGVDNVGFFPFPDGRGRRRHDRQYPANVGLPATFGSKTYTEGGKVADWLGCIASNYGEPRCGAGPDHRLRRPNDEVEQTAITATSQTRSTRAPTACCGSRPSSTRRPATTPPANAALLVTGRCRRRSSCSWSRTTSTP